jgi:hypothetical protein
MKKLVGDTPTRATKLMTVIANLQINKKLVGDNTNKGKS